MLSCSFCCCCWWKLLDETSIGDGTGWRRIGREVGVWKLDCGHVGDGRKEWWDDLECWVNASPANGWHDEAWRERDPWLLDNVWDGTGFGGMGTLEGSLNLRTKNPCSRVNGTYFGRLGVARRSLCGKRSLGVRAASITWCPRVGDVTVKQDKKLWDDEGICQQSRMVKVMVFPMPAGTQISTSPVPAILMSFPKAVR